MAVDISGATSGKVWISERRSEFSRPRSLRTGRASKATHRGRSQLRKSNKLRPMRPTRYIGNRFLRLPGLAIGTVSDSVVFGCLIA